MSWDFSLTSFIFFVSAGMAALIAWLLWQRRAANGAPTLGLMMVSVALWGFSNGMEISSPGLAQKTIWFIFSVLWATSTPVLMFIFALQYTRKRRWLTRFKTGLLWAPLVITIPMVLGNNRHHLMWVGLSANATVPSHLSIDGYGAWLSALTVYLYVLFLSASLLLLITALTQKGIYRSQAISLLAGVSIPILVNLIYMFFPNRFRSIDLTPIALTLMGLILTLGIYHLRIFDLMPVARDALFETLQDGIIVVDRAGRIADMNPAASRMVGMTGAALLGKETKTIPGIIQPLLSACHEDNQSRVEMVYGENRENVLEARISQLDPAADGGRLILLRDITLDVQRQAELQKHQQHLEELVGVRTANLSAANLTLQHEVAERQRAEEALQASEAELRALLAAMTDVILVMDGDGRYCKIAPTNPGALFRSAEDLLGKTYHEILPKETAERFVDCIRRVLETDEPENLEYMLLIRGEERWFTAIITPMTDELVVWVARDITTRKAAEADLARHQEQLEELVSERTSELAETNTRLVQEALVRQGAEESEREARRLAEALRDSAMALSSSLDVNVVLDKILANLERVIAFDLASLWLVDKDGVARVARHRGFDERGLQSAVEERVFKVADTDDFRRMAASMQPLIIPDLREEKGWIWVEGLEWLRSYLAAPILVNNEAVGFIELDSGTPAFYNQANVDHLVSFTWQAGVAIQKARLFEAVRGYAREIETMQQVILTTASSLDYDEVLRQILEQIRRVIPSDSASLMILEDGEVVVKAYRGKLDAAGIVGNRFAYNESTLAEAVKRQRPFNVPDVQAEYPVFRNPPHNAIHSVLVTPLIVRGEVMGALNLDSYEYGHFRSEDERIAESFSAQVAIALENADLYQKSQRRLTEQSVLNEVTRIVSSSLALDEVTALVYQQVNRFIKIRFFMIASYDAATEEWYSLFLRKDGEERTRMHWKKTEGMTGEVFETRKPLFLRNSAEVEGFLRQSGRKSVLGTPKSIMVVPLIVSDHLIGAMGTQDEENENAYSEGDFILFSSIATQVAVSFENARLFEKTEQLAITDGLTGIFNRRHFFVLGEIEVERALRYNKDVAVIMLDLDHFKRVNDTYGHSVGDSVLQAVTKGCGEILRKIDIFGRYGGEEFVILMPETDLNNCRLAAERLREGIAAMRVTTPQGVVCVTASLGVAAMDEHSRTLEALLEVADQRMFAAKEAGRNRVVG